MNKNGFTLMELLVVIAILGIMSLIAIPNMLGISDDVKKENMLDDAKKLISLAKYQVNIDYDARKAGYKKYTFNELDIDGGIKTDPDGGSYDKNNSYVEYRRVGASATYCIYLKASLRHIGDGPGGATPCIEENNLYSKKNVVNN